MNSLRSAVKKGDDIKRSIQEPVSMAPEGGENTETCRADEGKTSV